MARRSNTQSGSALLFWPAQGLGLAPGTTVEIRLKAKPGVPRPSATCC